MPKILYVEDNEDNVYMLRRRLAKHGYEMIVAGDGERDRALEAGCDEFETKPVDLPRLLEKIVRLTTARVG